MDIFSIPAEVVDANLLPHLDWNDLLRFRRVCKWTKAITDGYLKVHPELAPEIQINEEGAKTLQAFMEMGIPTSKIFLNNTSGAEFYENCGKDLSDFQEQYGRHIKFLRVDQISLLFFDFEWDFLNSLKNLESFQAKSYGGYRRGLSNAEAVQAMKILKERFEKESKVFKEDGVTVFPPEIIEKLKVLKIGNNDEKVLGNPIEYCQMILLSGKSFQTLAIPFNPFALPGSYFDPSFHNEGPLALTFKLLEAHMSFPTEEEAALKNCKEIDFSSFHDYPDESFRCKVEYQGSNAFLGLCNACFEGDIKLLNVAPSWFQPPRDMVNPRCLVGRSIISLVNIDPHIFPVELPNLEKIVITGTSKSCPGPGWRDVRPEWPALKTLEIMVDSKKCCYAEWIADINKAYFISMNTKELYSFLFQDVSRIGMTELKLEFKEGDGSLPVPKTEHIVASCPNLKKLTLVNWLGTNVALTKLWSGLPGLEEVSLESCKDLGNAAFVGKDVKEPVFLKLKKLKKLTLKGLDRMPKITDTLFSLVIRHLELTHLILTSDAPMKSVTLAGIRSLSEGKYAESIKKFPFQDWGLANVSAEEFKKLEVMFRSYYML